jgi:hypothetical protein
VAIRRKCKSKKSTRTLLSLRPLAKNFKITAVGILSHRRPSHGEEKNLPPCEKHEGRIEYGMTTQSNKDINI